MQPRGPPSFEELHYAAKLSQQVPTVVVDERTPRQAMGVTGTLNEARDSYESIASPIRPNNSYGLEARDR